MKRNKVDGEAQDGQMDKIRMDGEDQGGGKRLEMDRERV